MTSVSRPFVQVPCPFLFSLGLRQTVSSFWGFLIRTPGAISALVSYDANTATFDPRWVDRYSKRCYSCPRVARHVEGALPLKIRKPHPRVPLRATKEHFSGVAALFFFCGEGFHLGGGLVITVLTHVQVPSGHIVILNVARAFCMGP